MWNALEGKKGFIVEMEREAGKKLPRDWISVPVIQQLLLLLMLWRERRRRMTRWLLCWLTGRVRLRENMGGWRVNECERLINLYCPSSQNDLSSETRAECPFGRVEAKKKWDVQIWSKWMNLSFYGLMIVQVEMDWCGRGRLNDHTCQL